jgi:hypothetical protein
MRQPQLISPEQQEFDRQTHRFKPSFSRLYSSFAFEVVAISIVIEIIYPFLSTSKTGSSWIAIVLVFLVGLPITRIAMKFMSIAIEPQGLRGLGNLLRRIDIDWQDIVLVRSSSWLGIRTIHIKSKSNKSRNIGFGTYLYNLPKMLDRVREYAGVDHPLTIALEKEVSLPRQKPFKNIWRIIAGMALTISIWIIGGNLYADYKAQPLEREIANYVRQHPKTPPNQTAIALQASMAKLGISYPKFSDGSSAKIQPTQAALADWKTIETILPEYLDKQLNRPEGSVQKPPAKLQEYLNKHRSDLNQIQELLAGKDFPISGSDLSWIERDSPNFFKNYTAALPNHLGVYSVSRLLIADIFDRQPSSNLDSSRSLVAIKNLNRYFQNGKTLAEQIIARIGEHNLSQLFRHTDLMPVSWEENTVNPDRDRMMQSAIENELMVAARIVGDPPLMEMLIDNEFALLKFAVRYHNLVRPYIRVIAVDNYQKNQKNLSYWKNQNICQADGKMEMLDLSNWLDVSFYFPSQYIKLKTSDLDRELTTSIRTIKSQLKAGAPADKVTNDFKLASLTCPGERWQAKVQDGTIAISLSHAPNWTALGIREKQILDRYTYKIDPVIIKNSPPSKG